MLWNEVWLLKMCITSRMADSEGRKTHPDTQVGTTRWQAAGERWQEMRKYTFETRKYIEVAISLEKWLQHSSTWNMRQPFICQLKTAVMVPRPLFSPLSLNFCLLSKKPTWGLFFIAFYWTVTRTALEGTENRTLSKQLQCNCLMARANRFSVQPYGRSQ